MKKDHEDDIQRMVESHLTRIVSPTDAEKADDGSAYSRAVKSLVTSVIVHAETAAAIAVGEHTQDTTLFMRRTIFATADFARSLATLVQDNAALHSKVSRFERQKAGGETTLDTDRRVQIVKDTVERDMGRDLKLERTRNAQLRITLEAAQEALRAAEHDGTSNTASCQVVMREIEAVLQGDILAIDDPYTELARLKVEHASLLEAVRGSGPENGDFSGIFWDEDGCKMLGYDNGRASRQSPLFLSERRNSQGFSGHEVECRQVTQSIYDEDMERVEHHIVGYLIDEELVDGNVLAVGVALDKLVEDDISHPSRLTEMAAKIEGLGPYVQDDLLSAHEMQVVGKILRTVKDVLFYKDEPTDV